MSNNVKNRNDRDMYQEGIKKKRSDNTIRTEHYLKVPEHGSVIGEDQNKAIIAFLRAKRYFFSNLLIDKLINKLINYLF